MPTPKMPKISPESEADLLKGKNILHLTAAPAYMFVCSCRVPQLIPINLFNKPILCGNCGRYVQVHLPKE